MRSKLFILCSLVLVLLIKVPLVQGDIINGDFSKSGLTQWNIDGNVAASGGIAVLSTEGMDLGALISLNQGTGTIPDSAFAFDFGFSEGTLLVNLWP